MRDPVVSCFSDGGCVGGNPSPIGGTWAALHVDVDGHHIWEAGGCIRPREVGAETVTNNVAEFYALLMALETLPKHWSGVVYSDSQVTLGRFFDAWALNGIPTGWQRRMGIVLERLGEVTPVLLDGHPTQAQLAAGVGKRGHPVSAFNVWCDARCQEEARRVLAEREMVGAGRQSL